MLLHKKHEPLLTQANEGLTQINVRGATGKTTFHHHPQNTDTYFAFWYPDLYKHQETFWPLGQF